MRTLATWTIVCTVSAIPSFFWGWNVSKQNWPPMLIGIMIFVVAYVIGDYATRPFGFRRDKIARRTMLIGYWTRMLISTFIPVGFYIDLFAGLIAIEFWGWTIQSSDLSFGGILLLTVTTGVILNIVVLAYMVLVFGVQHAIKFIWFSEKEK